MNHVTTICPHCGHADTDTDHKYSAAPIPVGRGRFRRQAVEGGATVELADGGELTCDHCGEKFLYRLTTVVAVETAKPPVYS